MDVKINMQRMLELHEIFVFNMRNGVLSVFPVCLPLSSALEMHTITPVCHVYSRCGHILIHIPYIVIPPEIVPLLQDSQKQLIHLQFVIRL